VAAEPRQENKKNGLRKTVRRIEHWWMSILKKLKFWNVLKTVARNRVMDF